MAGSGGVATGFSGVLALLAGAGACNRDGDQALSARIEKAASAGDDVLLDMAALTAFPWERLRILEPYMSRPRVEKELGFSWRHADRIRMDDGIALLAFVRDGEVVRHVAHRRDEGDLSDCFRPGGYAPTEATFRCRRKKSGHRRCLPASPSSPPA
jgi:hypothetical protein